MEKAVIILDLLLLIDTGPVYLRGRNDKMNRTINKQTMEKIIDKILEIMQKDVFWNVLMGLITLLTTLAGAKSYKDRKKRFLITYNPKYVVDNIQEPDKGHIEFRNSSQDKANTLDKDLHVNNPRKRRKA